MGWDSAVQDTVTGALASLISGGLVALISSRRHAPPQTTMNAYGVGNRQLVDNSQRTSVTVIDQRHTVAAPPRDSQANDDTGMIICYGIAMVVVTLAYVAAWPFVLGIIGGLAIVIGIWTARLRAHTLPLGFPVGWLTATCWASCVAGVFTTVLVIVAPHSAARQAEHIVRRHFSDFDNNPTSRADVVLHHGSDIVSLFRSDLTIALAYQAVGVIFAGALIVVSLGLMFVTRIGKDLNAGRQLPAWKVRLLRHAYRMDAGRFFASVVVAVLAVALASGLVHHAMTLLQNHSASPQHAPSASRPAT